MDRWLRAGMIALAGLSLTACEALAEPPAPTHRYVVEADMEALERRAEELSLASDALEATADVIRKRIEAFGGNASSITVDRGGRLVVETSGIEQQAMETIIGVTAKLEFRLVDEEALPTNTEQNIANPGSEILEHADPYWPRIAVRRLGGLGGAEVVEANANIDPHTNEFAVYILFNEEGAQRFAKLTTENVGRKIAIIVDDVVYSAPIIAEPILGGGVQISGQFTQQSANELAALIGSGALPTPFELVETTEID